MNRQKFDLKSPKLNGKKVTKRFFQKVIKKEGRRGLEVAAEREEWKDVE